MSQLDEIEEYKIIRTDGGEHEAGVPRYTVQPVSFPVTEETLDAPVKIIDFGESFIIGDVPFPKTLHTPMEVRAPEVVLGVEFGLEADVWSAGCLVSSRSLAVRVIATETCLIVADL